MPAFAAVGMRGVAELLRGVRLAVASLAVEHLLLFGRLRILLDAPLAAAFQALLAVHRLAAYNLVLCGPVVSLVGQAVESAV